ncbi:ketopantoate reductase family protein [Curtobacterium sp. RRHDQ10]|uniref:ketopantoate reductase family protein n=1 Tax=Curtobacterium phyllosphaerae TaxID=3413379 RepID=UPI003BF368D6
MRYVVIGAGSIGGAIAARLTLRGPQAPLVVARGDRADVLRTRGLRLRTPDEDTTVPLTVVTAPEEAGLRPDDVLLLATKTHQADEALREWSDAPVRDGSGTVVGNAGDLLPVFTALNGVEAERIALRYFARVFGVTVWMPAVSLEPGEVVVRIGPTIGILTIGPVPAASPGSVGDDLLLRTLRDDFGTAGIDVYLEDDVMPWKYFKLLSNLANGLQALLGPDASFRDLSAALRDEAVTVYRAAGIVWTSEEDERARRGDMFDSRPVPGVGHELGGSSWQSMARGSGSIETDYLNGEIVRIARAAGVAAPRNALVQRLARVAARDHVAPGTLTVAELRAQFGAL